MRYAIVSDIHANFPAWKTVLTDIADMKADKIICLGDVVGYGSQPVSDRLDVWFDYLRIGHLDLDVMRFVPVTKPKKRRRPSSGRPAARRNGQVPESLRSGKESDPKVLPMS